MTPEHLRIDTDPMLAGEGSGLLGGMAVPQGLGKCQVLMSQFLDPVQGILWIG
ncbi:MAG: hypothetical protein WBM08_01200 [Prochlorococcaceae cyanobacterium]